MYSFSLIQSIGMVVWCCWSSGEGPLSSLCSHRI